MSNTPAHFLDPIKAIMLSGDYAPRGSIDRISDAAAVRFVLKSVENTPDQRQAVTASLIDNMDNLREFRDDKGFEALGGHGLTAICQYAHLLEPTRQAEAVRKAIKAGLPKMEGERLDALKGLAENIELCAEDQRSMIVRLGIDELARPIVDSTEKRDAVTALQKYLVSGTPVGSVDFAALLGAKPN